MLLPEGVVLNELRDIGGVPCGITVIQKEWRAVVHAVDLERGDEYSASSELHARYVEAAAPTPDQKINLYRELVDACAFRSTLEGRRKAQRKLEVMPSPSFICGPETRRPRVRAKGAVGCERRTRGGVRSRKVKTGRRRVAVEGPSLEIGSGSNLSARRRTSLSESGLRLARRQGAGKITRHGAFGLGDALGRRGGGAGGASSSR